MATREEELEKENALLKVQQEIDAIFLKERTQSDARYAAKLVERIVLGACTVAGAAIIGKLIGLI